MINYNIWFLPRFKKNIEIKHQRTYIWWAESRDAPRHLRTCRLETETIATGPLWSRTYSRTKEKSQRVNARGKRERAGMPRSLLSSTPSLALPILSSKSREPSVYIATRVERQRRPVINVLDAMLFTRLWKKRKKETKRNGEGWRNGWKSHEGVPFDSPLFFPRSNNKRRPLFASFKILKRSNLPSWRESRSNSITRVSPRKSCKSSHS